MGTIDLNVIELLTLRSYQHINLVSRKTYNFIHSKNYFIYIKLLDDLVS